MHLPSHTVRILDRKDRQSASRLASGNETREFLRRLASQADVAMFCVCSDTELREQVHAISTGQVTKMSQVTGPPDQVVRVGFHPLFES